MTSPEPTEMLRRLDLNLFKLFHEIARAGSIGGAAKRLNLQQPAVSLALKRLEDHLGVQLCQRTSRGIELTPAGQVVAALADEVRSAVKTLPAALATAQGEVEGVLTIHSISRVVSPELDTALAAMCRRHPRVRLHISIAPRRNVLDALIRDQAELCITFDSAPRADLRYEALVREYQQAYCSKGHPLFGRQITGPASLAAERFVLTGLEEPEEVQRFRQRYRLGERPAGVADNLDEAMRLIGTGAGIGFLPTVLVQASAAQAQFWPLLPPGILPNYLLYLISKPERDATTPTVLFLREIRRLLQARVDF
jgi:DNA-binding transcriptional LysR family regulator